MARYYCLISSLIILQAFVIFGLNEDGADRFGLKRTERVRREADGNKDTLSQFQELIREARTDDGLVDPNILLRKNIQDPIPIGDFNVSSSGLFTNIRGRFTNVQLYGLKDFQLTKIELNLSQMNLSAKMFVPLLSIVGDYVLDGSLTFVTISGNGGFWMNISSITLDGNSLFHSTPDGGLEMGDIQLQSKIEDIKLHFENLMGGGTWSRFSNSILNQLSELILDELKHTLLNELSVFLKTLFNDQLLKQLPKGLMKPDSSNIVDSILQHTGEVMAENGLDPVQLPDHHERFEQRMLFVNTHGELSLTNGVLHGLSSLYRKGDVIARFENHSLVFEAGFGFRNLTGFYDWQTKVFGVGPEALVEIQVNEVEGFLRIKQNLRAGTKLELDSFQINDIRQVWLDISGLGTWDYIMEVLVNLVSNGFKMHLADTISGPVKDSIQNQIDTFNITIT